MSRSVSACVLALVSSLFATGVYADFSGSLALLSDYRFRGVSLSDTKPAAQLGLAYDHPRGWYTGASLSTVQFFNQSQRTQFIPYLGYVQVHSDFNWEVGTDYYAFADNHYYDYPELYCGISAHRFSGRIYFAQHYFGQEANALYLEINDSRPFVNRVNLFYHVGVLHLIGSANTALPSHDYRYDLRVGFGIEAYSVNMQLAWVATDNGYAPYPVDESRNRNTLVLSLSRPF